MSLIELKNITKDFGATRVLENVTMTVDKGDVVAVVGNSGCGKTTLLRCMNLLERPTAGQVFIDGEELTAKGADVDRIRRRMGMVYQHFNLFSHLSVLENVTMAPRLVNHMPADEAKELGMRYLRMVGMQERADRPIGQLSGGQKQRVAIARCLAMQPEVVLFDEPTSALDPTMVDEVLAVIRNLVKNGLTCVIVTHEMDFARSVASRVVFLADGGIYEQASPEEFFNAPKGEKTKAFVRRVKLFTYESALHDLDLYTLLAQMRTYCGRYGFSRRAATRVQLVTEELVTFLQELGGSGKVVVQVSYEEKTGRKEFVLRDTVPGGNHLEDPRLDELSSTIVRNCAGEIQYTTENGYNVLSLDIRE